MIEKNRITQAEFLICKYAEDLFIELWVLLSRNLHEVLNLPSHNLSRDELIVLLWRMFESRQLIAETSEKGYFTPTLFEIENALDEPSKRERILYNTFYGFGPVFSERYNKLQETWQEDFDYRKNNFLKTGFAEDF